MATQRVIWTALPNGMAAGKRRLSILASPRAEAPADATLEEFQDFLHWREKTLTFRLRFEPQPAGAGATATVVAPAASAEQLALWSALFGPKMGVKGRTFDGYPGVNVLSFPALNVLSFVAGQYQKFASVPATATQLPAVEQLAGDDALRPLAFGWQGVRPRPRRGNPPVHGRLTETLDKNHAVPPSPQPDPELDFWQLKELVRPRNPTHEIDLSGGFKTVEFTKLFPKVMPTPAVDFHRALAALGDQPALLRAFGLLVDLEVGDAEVDSGTIPTSGWVSVVEVEASPAWQLEPLAVTPRTRYSPNFTARPKTADLSAGFLQLGSAFGLVDVDVEGAGLKLMNLANTVIASLYPGHRTADTPSRFSLPALRSGGLSLVRSGRALRLVERLNRLKVLESDAGAATPGKSGLTAEDIVRGYRVDVKDADDPTAVWASLCRRLISYEVGEGAARAPWPPSGQPPIEEEGWVKLGATSGADRSTEPDLVVTESLVRWAGWSLCARRPGKHIGTGDEPAQFPRAADAESETELKLATDVDAVPGSLPRLRFGRRYFMRVRAADLAGNGVPWTHDGASPAIGPAPYSRFEPVAAPTVVPREEPKAGESLERIVIRSLNDDPSKDHEQTEQKVDRHIAPQLASQLLSEQHGMFDGMSPAASYALVKERQGTYGKEGDEDGSGVVPHPEAQLPLPYLPDPLGRGAAFLGLPHDPHDALLGLPGAPPNSQIDFHPDGTKTVTDLNPTEKPPITLVHVDFGAEDAWPDLLPFRLHLVEGNGAPAWDADARVLEVQTPKATIARVRLSSVIDEDALSALGIWRWIEEKKPLVSAQTKKRLQQLALQARHWMLTPSRELVLVHAVQQPLLVPDISNLAVSRQFGSTSATLRDEVEVHARSTVKLDLDATWTEPLDPLTQSKWETRPGSSHAFEVPVDYPAPIEKPADNVAKINHAHELGDTKRRTLSYTVTATTRYREYFEDESLTFTRSRTRSEGLTIPSSARPAAPSVLYAVPTFGWDRPAPTAEGAKSVRAGGGVRIYLERPWFSSGEGELLGIVLMDIPQRGRGSSPRVIPDPLKPFVTQWGGDPVAGSLVRRVALKPQDLPRATRSRGRLTLDEVDPALHTVAVAGHEVEYDEERQLWYCDVELDPGDAYFPFVRFALARYQPESVERRARGGQPVRNVHLSRVVLAEFVQLAPHRTATVTFTSPTVVMASVAGAGIQHNVVEVGVEARRPDVPGELGWAPAPNAQVKQIFSASPKVPPRFEVTLPGPRGRRTPWRLVLREYEELPTEMGEEKLGRRLVYAETFSL
jgi:hypothetical protein